MIEFTISTTIKTTPHVIYTAWMNSTGHTRMTGSPAEIKNNVGTRFSAWDGYITGQNLELIADSKIRQSWRTVEFSSEEEDSILEITLEAIDGGTRLTLHHSNLPPHGAQYEQGWEESYFQPMKDYFETI